jgi:SAM-dependent methyltransferase
MNKNNFSKYVVIKKCDLCGSKKIDDYFKSGNIVKCIDCNFLFVSPRPSKKDIRNSYSEKGFYDAWIHESEGRLRMWQKRLKRIKRYIFHNSNILDYGAGIGTFMHLIKNDGHNAFGTELSVLAKKIAADAYDIKLYKSEYFFKPKYHNYFDIITAWHVIEHVTSPMALVKEFFKILQFGGYLFVAVPNAEEKKLKYLFLKQDNKHNYPELKSGEEIHLSHFSNDTIMRLLKIAGFSIVNIDIDYHYPISTYKNRVKYILYKLIYRVININYSPTIFIVAKKCSHR